MVLMNVFAAVVLLLGPYAAAAVQPGALRAPPRCISSNAPGNHRAPATNGIAATLDGFGLEAAATHLWKIFGGSFATRSAIETRFAAHAFPTYLLGRPSAHDFLTDVGLQAQVMDLASAAPSAQADPRKSAKSRPSIAVDDAALTVIKRANARTMHITFADGSSIRAQSTANELATYVPGSSRDQSGHVLPDPDHRSPAYTGRWHYPPSQYDDRSRFIAYMRGLGVTIASVSGNADVIICRWTPATRTTTCEVPN